MNRNTYQIITMALIMLFGFSTQMSAQVAGTSKTNKTVASKIVERDTQELIFSFDGEIRQNKKVVGTYEEDFSFKEGQEYKVYLVYYLDGELCATITMGASRKAEVEIKTESDSEIHAPKIERPYQRVNESLQFLVKNRYL